MKRVRRIGRFGNAARRRLCNGVALYIADGAAAVHGESEIVRLLRIVYSQSTEPCSGELIEADRRRRAARWGRLRRRRRITAAAAGSGARRTVARSTVDRRIVARTAVDRRIVARITVDR